MAKPAKSPDTYKVPRYIHAEEVAIINLGSKIVHRGLKWYSKIWTCEGCNVDQILDKAYGSVDAPFAAPKAEVFNLCAICHPEVTNGTIFISDQEPKQEEDLFS